MKKLFAIFGDPVSHSRSPLMHNMVFKNLKYDAAYIRVHLKDGSKLKDTFLNLKLDGANITVPHKEAAYEACDEVRGFAKKVKVVNTIVNENGRLIGYNTDADGFMYSIDEFTDIKKVLVIGAGGTSRALVEKFSEENLEVDILNRSRNRFKNFECVAHKCYVWDEFILKPYDLVINTTSAGLRDEHLPAPKEILERLFHNAKYAADVIYGVKTPFLALAEQHNIPYKDGADMLLGQGVLANELFTNNELNIEDIQKEMKKSFDL
jgi:shikimate dehydrogenase